MVITFKQEEEEPLVKAWERFRGIAFGMEHGLRDWMLVHVFYKGLSDTSRTFLDDECEGAFMNTNATNALLLLDCLLVEVKIKKSLEKAKVPEEDVGVLDTGVSRSTWAPSTAQLQPRGGTTTEAQWRRPS
jgi:hypothetical protein